MTRIKGIECRSVIKHGGTLVYRYFKGKNRFLVSLLKAIPTLPEFIEKS